MEFIKLLWATEAADGIHGPMRTPTEVNATLSQHGSLLNSKIEQPPFAVTARASRRCPCPCVGAPCRGALLLIAPPLLLAVPRRCTIPPAHYAAAPTHRAGVPRRAPCCPSNGTVPSAPPTFWLRFGGRLPLLLIVPRHRIVPPARRAAPPAHRAWVAHLGTMSSAVLPLLWHRNLCAAHLPALVQWLAACETSPPYLL
jgi:hypothetical protein